MEISESEWSSHGAVPGCFTGDSVTVFADDMQDQELAGLHLMCMSKTDQQYQIIPKPLGDDGSDV